jgi:hypothetical protein
MVCTFVFTLVAGGGYLLFGSSTQANILNNLAPSSLSPIVGTTVASALSFSIRLGYCISLTVRPWDMGEHVSSRVGESLES